MRLNQLVYRLLLIHSFGVTPLFAQSDKRIAILISDELATSEEAFHYLDSIRNRGGLETPERVLLYEKMAICALEINDIKALSILSIEGIKTARIIENDSSEAFFYKFLAISQGYNEKLEEAVENFKKSAEIAKLGGYTVMEASNYNNIGGTLIDLERMEEAEYFLLKSIELSTKNGLPSLRNKLLSYRLLATLYDRTERSEKAGPIYEQVHEDAVLLNDTNLICSNLVFHAHYLKKIGNLEEALKKTEEAAVMTERYGDQQTLLTTLQFHAGNLTEAQRFEESNEVQGKIILLLKTLYKTENQQQINALETAFKTNEIEQEKRIAQAEAAAEGQKKKLYLSILITVFSLSIVTFLLLYARHLKIRNKSNALLQRERLASLLEGQENERTRIAKELHDGIVQDLVALQLSLNSAENRAPIIISAEIDRISTDLRNISYEMMPVTLQKFGLIEAFNDLFERSLRQKGLAFEFEHVGMNERLSEKIEVSIYRICQELVHNAIKHSEASIISVVLRKNVSQLIFIFEDNGKGFDFDEIKSGIGLNSVQSRIETVRGSIQFDTNPNEGTVVFIQIPL